MEPVLVTVVVPVYGVEQYLDRCVRSIVGQTYQNLEILLIDDGSPDRCPQLCDTWAGKDSRIRVIHQANAGLGMARNTGIENAAGDYLCFVDSDDRLQPDAVALSLLTAQKTGAEYVLYGMSQVDRRGNRTGSAAETDLKQFYSGLEIQEAMLPELLCPKREHRESVRFSLSACQALFSMNLIHRTGWRFCSEREIISEDIYSLLDLFRHIQKAAIVKKTLYDYYHNDGSLTHVYRPDRYEKIRYCYEKCMELCDSCGYSDAVRKSCGQILLNNTFAALKQEAASAASIPEKRKRIRSILDDDLLQKALREKERKYLNLKKRIFFFAMEKKIDLLCYFLLKLRG